MPKLQNSEAKDQVHNWHAVSLFFCARLLLKKGSEAEMGWMGRADDIDGRGRSGIGTQYLHPYSPA